MRLLLLFVTSALFACFGIPGVEAPVFRSNVPARAVSHAPRTLISPDATAASDGLPSLTTSESFARNIITPVTHAEPLPIGIPVRLEIPSIGLATDVERVGLTPERKPDIPKSPFNAGWYDLGPRPGEEGAAVIDGVLDTAGGPAVFWKLNGVNVGDTVSVEDDGGGRRSFIVRAVKLYDVRTAPMREIYTGTGRKLRLITCAGTWDTSLGHYDRRLVVFAELEE
ncbi:MAG: class F sortase [Candidatus Peribacteraceae bacterium]|jgi:hypothetical protein